jgi:predicted esterase
LKGFIALLLGLAACATGQDGLCPSADDGVCDELSTCALGTDEDDCGPLCTVDFGPDLAGICAHRLAGEAHALENPTPSGGAGGPVGTWDGTVVVRGSDKDTEVTRHYRVYVPESYHPDRPIPVLFNLGGFQVDLYFLGEYTELNRTADLNDFIVVYGQPEWRDFGSYWVFAWYVYNAAWQGTWAGNPDLEYLEAVYEEIASRYNTDRSRTYVSGHSRGGAMSLIASFELPDRFAGASAQAGFIGANDYADRMAKRAAKAHPGIHLLHGTKDSDVPVSNSDQVEELLTGLGWLEGEDLRYDRLKKVTHEWQPQLNQEMWDFLSSHQVEAE